MNIKKFVAIIFAVSTIILGVQTAMALEEASYVVIKKDKEFEVREYTAHILAETVVEGDMEQAGNIAFKKLYRYISGDNVSSTEVAMTTPVSQEPTGEKIKMTAPVGQQLVQEKWVVSFMMPKAYSLSTLPQPLDSTITLRQVPARRMAAVRYSGTWSEKNYLSHKLELESWMRRTGLTSAGSAIWARYNSPMTPWFLRRNEILIPIE